MSDQLAGGGAHGERPAELVAQQDELRDFEDLGKLDEYDFRGARPQPLSLADRGTQGVHGARGQRARAQVRADARPRDARLLGRDEHVDGLVGAATQLGGGALGGREGGVARASKFGVAGVLAQELQRGGM